MAVIYLRHPVHGAKVATMEMEAAYDQRNGWERYTPGEESAPDDPLVVNELRRRGRPRKEPEHVHSG